MVKEASFRVEKDKFRIQRGQKPYLRFTIA